MSNSIRNCGIAAFIFFVLSAKGQEQSFLQIDSLRHEFQNAKSDTSRIQLLVKIGEAYRTTRPDSAFAFANKALTYSQKVQWKNGEAIALCLLSVLHREKGNLPYSLELALKALRISKDNKYLYGEVFSIVRIANTYLAAKNFSRGLFYLKQADEELKITPDIFLWSVVHEFIADCYIQLNDLDSAKVQLKLLEVTNPPFMQLDAVFITKGDLAAKEKNLPAAIFYYRKSVDIAMRDSNYRYGSTAFTRLASLYRSMNKIDSAIYCAKEGLEYGQMLGYENRILAPAELLAQLYESRDIKESVNYYKIASAAKDSLYGADKVQKLQSMTMEEQERQNQVEAEKVAYQNKVRQYALLGGVAIFLIVAVFLFRNNRQKQKANELLKKQKQEIEEQKRRAQIETSLEKVRSIAMGMRHREDMLDICRTIAKELQQLGVKEIRNVQTAILYDEKGFFTNYEYYAKHNKVFITETEFRNHPIAEQFAQQMMKGPNEFFMHSFTGKEVQEWLAHQKTTNVFIDSYLETATTLNYYWYSLGPVAMGTSTYVPLNEEEQELFKRFRNVFELAYRRYLDIEQAITQAREAEIELALERVRAKAMAMQKPSEFVDVINVVGEQFIHLGFDFNWVNFSASGHDISNGIDIWNFVSFGEYHGANRITIPVIDHSVFTKAAESVNDFFRSGEELSVVILDKKDKDSFVDHLLSATPYKDLPDEVKKTQYEGDGYLTSNIVLKDTWLSIGRYSTTPFTDEQNAILRRLANAFGQAHTRFLDLQKAEAQAKENQIQLALERVRARTMAMQKSDELSDTAYILFQQFRELDEEPLQITIGIFKEEERMIEFSITGFDGSGERIEGSFKAEIDEPILLNGIYKAWKEKKSSAVFELSGKELTDWIAYRNKLSGASQSSTTINDKDHRSVVAGFFSKGFISFSKAGTIPNETITILERFAGVFDGTYTRFLDLQKAEAQAREAKIEAALEKVRSRTLAMQKSDELVETAAVLFRQLINLGIEPNRLYINIIKDEKGNAEFWITDEDGGKVSSAFEANLNDNATFERMYSGWREQKRSLIIDMHGNELKEYFEFLGSIHVPFKGGLAQKRRVQHIAYFSKGFIGIAAPEEQSHETIELLERFAYVFNLTFTRFNDLKVAEAHALQAEQDLLEIKIARKKAEETLSELQSTQKQLIQSEKMASLGELTAGIAHEIQNPLNFINNFSDVNKELIQEMKEEIDKGNIEDVKTIADDISENETKINHHGKRADAIVKSMLQHSRKSSGQKEPTDINALVDEYLRLSYHGLRAKDKSFNAILETHFDPAVGKASVVGQDIGRVLLNLFNNAFYAVNAKKNGDQNYEPTVQVITTKTSKGIEIKVKDNGTGIPEKVLEKIYQPFFTTKPTGEGTGLGLSLSYDIITKAHGGEMKVETREGEGSEFIIQLPIASNQ